MSNYYFYIDKDGKYHFHDLLGVEVHNGNIPNLDKIPLPKPGEVIAHREPAKLEFWNAPKKFEQP